MDIVLRNATIIDGTGAPSRPGDVVINGDRIAQVRPPRRASRNGGPARLEIDCAGLFVAPGFIDIHSHSDLTIFMASSAANYVSQGVTFLVNGNCGSSGAPIDLTRPDIAAMVGEDRRIRDIITWTSFVEYMDALDRTPKGINIATFVGHGNVRASAMGVGDGAPAQSDLEKMKALVREAMEAGALGLSTGLVYAPGMFAATEEIIELAKVAGEYGAIYSTHLRSESDLLVEAVLEAIRIGRESGCRVQISHHKCGGRRNWGLVRTTLDLMEYHRRLGVEITCDAYPCIAGATGLAALLPPWAQRSGKDGTLALFKDPASRERIKTDLGRPVAGAPNFLYDSTPAGVRITDSRVAPQYLGMSLADIAKEEGKDPLDVMLDLLAMDFDTGVTLGRMNEDDVRYVLAHRLSMICSDASIALPEEGLPHPRTYRAFTRTLATYTRDEKLMGLEQAIYKMTGFPAWKLGLPDRGVLRPGAKADVVAFDLWGLATAADYGDPHHLSEGMAHVLVNGEFVIRDGRPTGAKPGELVRRPS